MQTTIEKEEKTPPKDSKTTKVTPLKETKGKFQLDFKTPEKNLEKTKSPIQKCENLELKFDQTNDGDDGMISTTEQARLLIAASKTPSKSINKTPVKKNTPNGKRSVENSPSTPGKYRRVELITLESPKAKRIKKI